ncbi:MAG: ATP-binding protein [Tidjanibacter sp.]|nr:ATP-binding protein [Tidjanibacter sp.]
MKTVVSPFRYGTLAVGASFVNRVAERKLLKDHLLAGINVMLVSPRRWGKSSLVKESMTELQLQEHDVRVCYIDAMTILSEQSFYEVFAREIIRSTENNMEAWVNSAKRYLGAVSPRISFGTDPMNEFSLGLDFKAVKENELDILNLPEKIAQKRGIRIIVCIDEFQNLANLRVYADLERKMRSVWQQQQNVSYCLYGSKRHMMMEIFNSSSKPFYRFGQIMFLEKIALDEWVDYIVRQFNVTGKQISVEEATRIVNYTEAHSWYVQQLSHFVWLATSTRATSEIVDRAFDRIVETNQPMFQTECDSLSSTQLSLLRAIAKGESEFTSVRVMSYYSLGTPQNVVKNKKILSNKDLINIQNRVVEFVDPLFKYWFANTYH